MSKRMIWALLLIMLVVIVLVLTRGKTDVNLLVTQVKVVSSMVFLTFTVLGVVIGLLLK